MNARVRSTTEADAAETGTIGAGAAERPGRSRSIVISSSHAGDASYLGRVRYHRHPSHLKEAFARCSEFARSERFDHFAFVMRAQLGPDDVAQVTVTNYPLKWRQEYDRRGYFEIDPIAQSIFRMVGPIRWKDVPRSGRSAAMLRRAEAYGLVDGITLTVRGPGGLHAALNLVAPRFPVSDGDYDRCVGRAFRFLSDEYDLFVPWLSTATEGPSRRALTDRQIQVLSMIAEGWPMKAIAAELGVEERTIQDTMERVRRNLGVPTREQAIVRATGLGLIRPTIAPFQFY